MVYKGGAFEHEAGEIKQLFLSGRGGITPKKGAIMEYIVHANYDDSFSVISLPEGQTINVYRGKDAARDAYREAIKLDMEDQRT